MSILELDEQFKSQLREKWLNYYQANRSWIFALNLQHGHRWQSNGYHYSRPSSTFIIPVMTALEPQLACFMPGWCKNGKLDQVLVHLGLDFDPDFAITQRELQTIETKAVSLLPESEA